MRMLPGCNTGGPGARRARRFRCADQCLATASRPSGRCGAKAGLNACGPSVLLGQWREAASARQECSRLNDTTAYRLVIADDHPLFRGALREAVSGLFAGADIAEAGSFDDVVKLLDRTGEVDLVLLDLAMPGVRGFSG